MTLWHENQTGTQVKLLIDVGRKAERWIGRLQRSTVGPKPHSVSTIGWRFRLIENAGRDDGRRNLQGRFADVGLKAETLTGQCSSALDSRDGIRCAEHEQLRHRVGRGTQLREDPQVFLI